MQPIITNGLYICGIALILQRKVQYCFYIVLVPNNTDSYKSVYLLQYEDCMIVFIQLQRGILKEVWTEVISYIRLPSKFAITPGPPWAIDWISPKFKFSCSSCKLLEAITTYSQHNNTLLLDDLEIELLLR